MLFLRVKLIINMELRYLISQILSFFVLKPTEGQNAAIKKIAGYLLNSGNRSAFILKGYAGTGKTTLISAIIKYIDSIDNQCILLAPTGRAAKVLSSYSGHPAYTIHRHIYRGFQKGGNVGFSLGYNKYENTLFIVDESSMISDSTPGTGSSFGSGRLLDDLIEYVYSGKDCRLIFIGDSAQLPPVGQVESPALSGDFLRSLGVDTTGFELVEVVRQSAESGILGNATSLRNKIRLSDVAGIPRLKVNNLDVIYISGEALIDEISSSYSRVGVEESKVICNSNKRAVLYNLGIRNRVFFSEEELLQGEFLMIARNNYLWSQQYKEIPFIANGDIVEVIRIGKRYEMYGFKFADVTVRFSDYDIEADVRIVLDSMTAEAPALTGEQRQKLYDEVVVDYQWCRTKKQLYDELKKDKWLQSLQVKYGYAMTCHKAQGGQWKEIFLDQGWIPDERIGEDYYRWLYTAVTRATEKLFLVNFRDEFLER